MGEIYYLLCYTREAQEDSGYSRKSAYSMHLALSEDGEHFTALNHNSGILYAKAVLRPDGTLQEKSLAKPSLLARADGSFGVVAKRIEVDGSMDEELRELVLAFSSGDLIHYQELGTWNSGEDARTLLHEMGMAKRSAIVALHDAGISPSDLKKLPDGTIVLAEDLNAAPEKTDILTEDVNAVPEKTDILTADARKQLRAKRRFFGLFTQKERDTIRARITGAIPGNIIEISGETAQCLKERFLTPVNAADEAAETVLEWDEILEKAGGGTGRNPL